MKIGRVINNIWATRKDEALVGVKLLIVELLDKPDQNSSGTIIVAADIIGAGIGEKVLVTEGSSARQMGGMVSLPIDAIIVGIIDEEKAKVNGVAINE
ncbi:Ethanolamine utilization protein EutN [bioreactor metagenome]|uniref:Ethanolamine utilization protein EutN n=1 Tax=bioreactor metagenome TaxID=1076179 RepID=A0A645J7Y7_9ZZZZ